MVECNRSDSAHVGYGQRRESGITAAKPFELPPTLRSMKIAARHKRDAAGQGEFFRPCAAQHDVFRMLHDGARQIDWVLDVGDAAYRSGPKGVSVHDRRVQFVLAVVREYGSSAGIEKRVIFEHHHGAERSPLRHESPART